MTSSFVQITPALILDMFKEGTDVNYRVLNGIPADAVYIFAVDKTTYESTPWIELWFISESLDPKFHNKHIEPPVVKVTHTVSAP